MTEVVALSLLFQGQKDNLNIRGAYWHVVQAFVGSLIIIVAAVVIGLTGFLEIDPLLVMAFGLLLLVASYGILKESLNVSLDAAPSDIDLMETKADLEALAAVREAHHIHAWSVASGRTIFTAHLLVDDDAPEQLVADATQMLRDRYRVYFSTLQTERERLLDEPPQIEFAKTDDHAHH